jgi:O-antigen/teichoic acid export membrane protein
MTSGFLLLPMLLLFLSDMELGLWYVFVAAGNLAMLFELGFTPAFSRNITYCLSGVQKFERTGIMKTSDVCDVNAGLLKATIYISKKIYLLISFVVLALLLSLGSIYILHVSEGIPGHIALVAWFCFCVAIFINIYFDYNLAFLRGCGDIAAENKSKVIAKLSQLLLTLVLMCLGLGLIGASIGYLFSGLLQRFISSFFLKGHQEITIVMNDDNIKPEKNTIRDVFDAISYLAFKDGAVTLSLFAATQATSLIASSCLGLAETGVYSVTFQIVSSVASLSGAYPKSFYPSFQAAFSRGDIEQQRRIVGQGIVAYLAIYIFVSLISALILPIIISWIKPGLSIDLKLYILMSLYLLLLNQHSIFCNYIIGMNQIPYMNGYIVAALLGTFFSAFLTKATSLGVYGLILGEALAQLLYNNWKWPSYVAHELQTTYFCLLKEGMNRWCSLLSRYLNI